MSSNPVQALNRRELLLLAVNRNTRSVELSCERLYMKYHDSQLDNTSEELFERLAAEMRGVDKLVLVDTAWLACQDLKQRLEPLLVSVRARGGRIMHTSETPKDPKS
jgi:hypothetical protein